MDIIQIPDISENWLNKAHHWKASRARQHYTKAKRPSDILERLRVLSAVCKWQGQNDQSMEFMRAYTSLETKLKNTK